MLSVYVNYVMARLVFCVLLCVRNMHMRVKQTIRHRDTATSANAIQNIAQQHRCRPQSTQTPLHKRSNVRTSARAKLARAQNSKQFTQQTMHERNRPYPHIHTHKHIVRPEARHRGSRASAHPAARRRAYIAHSNTSQS